MRLRLLLLLLLLWTSRRRSAHGRTHRSQDWREQRRRLCRSSSRRYHSRRRQRRLSRGWARWVVRRRADQRQRQRHRNGSRPGTTCTVWSHTSDRTQMSDTTPPPSAWRRKRPSDPHRSLIRRDFSERMLVAAVRWRWRAGSRWRIRRGSGGSTTTPPATTTALRG